MNIARWAPSPHNTQPWQVRTVDDRRADLFMVRNRRLPDEDTTGCFLLCAMGIFIEAMRIAAANRGLHLGARGEEHLDLGRELIPFARLTLGPAAPPDEFSDRSLLERRTSRLPTLGPPLAAEVEARMAAIASAHGHRLHIAATSSMIDQVLDANLDAVMHDLADPRYGGEIRRWYRYTSTQGRASADGLEARCMNIPAHELWLSANCPWMLRTPGLRGLLRAVYARRIGATDRMLLLSGPFFERRAAENAGAMLLRLWLALHEGGGFMHPFGNLVTNARGHDRLTRAVGIEGIWLVARFGRTSEPPRSHRLPLHELIDVH